MKHSPATVEANQPGTVGHRQGIGLPVHDSGSADGGMAAGSWPEKSADPERFFKLRAWRRGPWIPARTFKSVATDPLTGETLDRSPHLLGERNGQPCDPTELLIYGHPIDEDEYKWLTALSQTHPILKNWQRWRREAPTLMRRGRSGKG